MSTETVKPPTLDSLKEISDPVERAKACQGAIERAEKFSQEARDIRDQAIRALVDQHGDYKKPLLEVANLLGLSKSAVRLISR